MAHPPCRRSHGASPVPSGRDRTPAAAALVPRRTKGGSGRTSDVREDLRPPRRRLSGAVPIGTASIVAVLVTAVGFVPKTTPASRLAEILRAVAGGRRYVDPDIAASALTEDDGPLTQRELDVLRAARTGISVEEIAREAHLAPGTVRHYLSNAMGKRHVESRHAAAHRAWEENGSEWLRWKPDPRTGRNRDEEAAP